MRSRYLVAYDIADPGRLREVHRAMLGFGDPMQYSVFLCELSPKERVILISALSDLIHHAEDRILLVDLGPVGGRGDSCIEFLGQSEPPTERGPLVV